MVLAKQFERWSLASPAARDGGCRRGSVMAEATAENTAQGEQPTTPAALMRNAQVRSLLQKQDITYSQSGGRLMELVMQRREERVNNKKFCIHRRTSLLK